ncbi:MULTISPECIES: hypothetical protein [unclassified Microcoleus]|uniref:hypothetical protein n=1 Tax=unclassified Microcoleus TaxID=2642155 RepID=UPI002FCEE9F1
MNYNDERYYQIEKYCDTLCEISANTREVIQSLKLAQQKLREALITATPLKKYSDVPISFVSNVTIVDVHRNLLFLDLLLSQTFGVTNTDAFRELLELTNFELKEDEW